MPIPDPTRASSPYRSLLPEPPREPWLERAGWRGESAIEHAIVAVHIAWGDRVLATKHLAEDGDCDPWRDVGAADAGERATAVRLRTGTALFFFADDPSSRVEGPGRSLSLEALREEGLVTRVSADRWAIAMEPGVIYRTRRFGLTVSAEIVERPRRLEPPKRLATIAMFAALFMAAFAVGAGANAVGEEEHPLLESLSERRDEATLARLLERAREEAAGREWLPREASRAAPERPRVVSPFIRLCTARLNFRYMDCFGETVGDDPWVWMFISAEPWPRRDEFEEPRVRWTWHSVRQHARVVSRSIREQGALPEATIARTIERNTARFAACTDASRDRGRVFVRFVIGGDGFVLGASVAESSLANPAVARCMVASLRRLVFSAPRDGGVVIGASTFVVDGAAHG